METEILTGNNLRVEYKDDTRIPNAGTFTIYNQDQTLGNLLKQELLNDKKNVLFTGYKKPHPLENCVKVKLQTVDEKHPVDILKKSVTNLIQFNDFLKKNFEDEMKKRIN
jgi:DNA-directed RNA polymerase II subunit RPB11